MPPVKGSQPESGAGIELAIATLIAILTTLSVNVLSNFFPPRGLNIGAIANTILQGVLITPANYAFAIWGLIYLGLIAYGLYQLQPSQRRQPVIQRLDGLLIVACIAQIVWVFLFTLQLFWLSVAAMLAILLPLIGAYGQLNRGQESASREWRRWVQWPFSLYLAWISVATIVNVASALYRAGWQGGAIGATGWTAIMLIVGAAIAAAVTRQRGDRLFPLVFIWAYIAIAIRQSANPGIWITATAAAIALGLLLADRPISPRQLH